MLALCVSAQAFSSRGATVETDGTEHKQWRIGENDSMQTVGQHGGRFTWELLEAESLQPTAMIIDGWELKPYKYHEEFQYDDVLRIEARVELSEDGIERFLELPLYFQVVRKDLAEQPREMRFGRCLWSRANNTYRVGLLLLDKKIDERGRHGINEPCESNNATKIARTSLILNRLLDALITKGLLSKIEADQMQKLEEKLLDRERWERDRVEDLDEWLNDEE